MGSCHPFGRLSSVVKGQTFIPVGALTTWAVTHNGWATLACGPRGPRGGLHRPRTSHPPPSLPACGAHRPHFRLSEGLRKPALKRCLGSRPWLPTVGLSLNAGYRFLGPALRGSGS